MQVAEDFSDTEIFVPRKNAKRDSQLAPPVTLSGSAAATGARATSVPISLNATTSVSPASVTTSSSFNRQTFTSYSTAQQSVHQFSSSSAYDPGKHVFQNNRIPGYPFQV